MWLLRFLAWILLAAGCSAWTGGQADERSPLYLLPAGTRLLLQKEVAVPAASDQIYFQHGRSMGWQQVNIYEPHCALAVAAKGEAPQPIRPDEFQVIESHSERFFKRVDAPARPAVLRPAGFGPGALADGDRDSGDSMPYEVTADVMQLRSERQPQVRSLTCADWGLPQDMSHTTVHKIREALGDYFVIQKPQAAK